MEPERQFVTLGDTGRCRRENDYCRLSFNQYLDLAAAIAPVVTAAPYPCDAFLMQRKYGIATLLFGPCAVVGPTILMILSKLVHCYKRLKFCSKRLSSGAAKLAIERHQRGLNPRSNVQRSAEKS